MKTYSPFFQTMEDARDYTILRCLSWHDEHLRILPKAACHDFIIVWDDDRDERVVTLAENIYVEGFLSSLIMLAETKGGVYGIISPNSPDKMHPLVESKLNTVAENMPYDSWALSDLLDSPFNFREMSEHKMTHIINRSNLGVKEVPTRNDNIPIWLVPKGESSRLSRFVL